MPIEQKIAWAALIGTPMLGLLMWGLAQADFHWPPILVYGAIALGGAGLLISVALWCHIGWVWIRSKGLQLGPAIVIAIGLALVAGGTVWGLLTWAPNPSPKAGQELATATPLVGPPSAASKPDTARQRERSKRLRRDPKTETVATLPSLPKEPAWPTDHEYVPLRAEQFMEIFKDKTPEERKTLVGVYKDDWMKIEGVIHSINGPDAQGQLMVYVIEKKTDSVFGTLVGMRFDKTWTKKIVPLQKETVVRAIGHISAYTADTAIIGTLMLDQSEIISTKSG